MEAFKKQLFVQLGIALGSIALVIGLAQFMVSQIIKTAQKIEGQKEELALRSSVTASLAKLRRDFDESRPFQIILDRVFPPKDDLINFGKDVISLGKQRSVDLGFNFGNESASTPEKPGFIAFSVNGDGSFDNFIKFLKDLEKSTLFIKINAIDLTKNLNTNIFKVILDGRVFFQ